MKPVLFECPLFSVYTYGVFVAFGFFVSTFLISIEARRKHWDENAIFNLCLLILFSGIVFARLFYVALNLDYFRENWLEIVMLQHGGLVWFGGFLGATAACLAFIKIKKLPLGETFDLLVPYVALGQSLGRIGCFFNGCCYGKPWDFGIFFPVHGATLFPSQLVDSFTLLIIFVVLKIVSMKKKKTGMVFAFSFVLFGLQRFLMEFIRGDERPFYFSLSIFQWISLFVSAVGMITLIYLWKKKSA